MFDRRAVGLPFVFLLSVLLAGCGDGSNGSDDAPVVMSTLREDAVPLYRVFQRRVTNSAMYTNKFTDVDLDVEYTAPSGRKVKFPGFYDGDGRGSAVGDVWKIRFMPDEPGTWRYTYSWSDGQAGGTGSFTAVADGAGRGVLKAYAENPRWFAYNGTMPVFLRSYHVGAAGFTGTPIDWAAANVYSRLERRGYNHVLLKALPIGWVDQKPADAPADHIGMPLWGHTPSVQNLEVWKRFEEHMDWLNARDIHVHFFMGFDPKGEASSSRAYFAQTRFHEMPAADQSRYVRYVVARLAPFANVAGWNYTWETDGSAAEQRLVDLLKEFDPWEHLATYHDESPTDNDFDNADYSFAGIENHGYFGNSGGAPALDSASHYQATIDGYRDKPVYMVEGNGLWRACWAKEYAEATVTRAAWAVTLAGGSFAWQDTSECFDGPVADMFLWPTANPIADRLDALYRVMTQEVAFHRMTPRNDLLGNCWKDFDRTGPVPSSPCFAIADIGSQYLVYKENGGEFQLSVADGTYAAMWIDTRTGSREPGGVVRGSGAFLFATPDTNTDWVLLLKTLS